MILVVSHRNRFKYVTDVSLARHLVHLTPRSTRSQTCHRHRIVVEPKPDFTARRLDFFGNSVQFITLESPHRRLSIRAESVVEVADPDIPEPSATTPWDEVHEILVENRTPDGLAAQEMAFESPHAVGGPEIGEYARISFPPGRPVLEGALDLTARINREFKYDSGVTTIDTPVDEILRKRHGVCQDFAHLQIACLRQIGLPARYVSGYLLTRPPEGRERLVGADASHAWVSVWCPGTGWIDLDPTNNLIPREEHVTLAWGRDYGDVSPVRGVVVGGAAQDLDVAVDVMPANSLEETATAGAP